MKKKSKSFSGDRLRAERSLNAWSQGELAEKLGTSQSMVSNWEGGLIQPNPFFLDKLQQVFGKPLKELGFILENEYKRDNYADSPRVRSESDISSEEYNPSASARGEQPHFYRRIPFLRDLFFTGREKVLEDIHAILNSENHGLSVLAVTGSAGVGKTHVALEYAYRFQQEYQSVLWLSADNLFPEIRQLASIFKLEERQEADISLVIGAVKQWFCHSSNWLIILDNVDDIKMLHDILPYEGNGHVLLTTTLPPAGFITSWVEVTPMDLNDGTTFLLRRAKRIEVSDGFEDAEETDQKYATAIAEELGGLSLALDQAGAYIEESSCSLSDYLERYRVRRSYFLDRRGWSSATHPLSLATTLSLSFEKVGQCNPASIELLRLCSLFYPTDIPEEMITGGAPFLSSPLLATVTDPHLFDEAIMILRKYALVRRRIEIKTLSLHRLVQVVLKEGMAEADQRYRAEQVLGIVSNILPPFEFFNWMQAQRYMAQAQYCLDLIDEYQLLSQEATRILIWISEYFGETLHDIDIEPLLQRAVNMTRDLESGHVLQRASLNALAIFYFNQSRYQEAEPLLRQVIELGEDNIDLNTATSLNNLGELYYMQARYPEAELLFKQAIKIRTLLAGDENPLVATSLCCLAKIYVDQNEYEKAKPLFERSLEIRESALGDDHIAVADSLESLAGLYMGLAMPEDARSLYQRAITIYEKEWETKREKFALALRGLGETYFVQKEFEDAERIFSEVLAIYNRNEVSSDVDKAQVLRDLAWVYVCYREKVMEAEPLLLEALDIRSNILGAHPDTAASYLDLGRLYGRMGNYMRSVQFYQQALNMYAQTLGLDCSMAQRTKKEYDQLLLFLQQLENLRMRSGKNADI